MYSFILLELAEYASMYFSVYVEIPDHARWLRVCKEAIFFKGSPKNVHLYALDLEMYVVNICPIENCGNISVVQSAWLNWQDCFMSVLFGQGTLSKLLLLNTFSKIVFSW